MWNLRSLIAGTLRSKGILNKVKPPAKIQKYAHTEEGPPQPFDNLPFSIPNRYVATFVFSFLFGSGLWAPFLIVWYSMAKRTL